MREYYKNEWGELWHGDCLEVMDLLEIVGPMADMVLCDPPYGTTQNKWDAVVPLEKMWPRVWACTKSSAAVVLTAQAPFDKVLGASCIDRLKYEWIWRKEAGTGFLNAKIAPLKDHENALVFYTQQPTYNPQMRTGFKPYSTKKGHHGSNYGSDKGAVTESNGERYPVTTIEFQRDRDKLHPTQKPVALFAYLIQTYTNPGEVVLDFCAGSGTTAVAAEMTGRKWVCIEKEEKYCELIAKRLDARRN